MEVTKRKRCMAKRIVSIILTAAILMSVSFETALAGVNATADMVNDGLDGAASDNTAEQSDNIAGRSDDIAERAFRHENYEIIYTVKSEWQNHQVIEMTLKNIGETGIKNWVVSVGTSGSVTGLWNAVLLTADENDGDIMLKNAGWNSVIQPGQSVVFGCTLEGESLSFPADIFLCPVAEKTQETAEAKLVITGEWEEGFQGELHIYNNSEKAVSGWRMAFSGNFEINNLWNGELVSDEDGTYTISHTSWQNEIPAGGEHVVGFTGTKTAEEPQVRDCIVYGIEEYPTAGGVSGENKPSTGAGKEEETNPEETVNWEDDTDTDNDGLPDVYEKYMYKSSPENADSDGDGLPDGYEVRSAGTSPVLADSNEDGISDGDSDEDGDGLTNMQEYLLGTNPLAKDTDYDGLGDLEEPETYETDPLNADSDGDGISDGDEAALGLDPLNPATNGTPDNLYCIPQEIDADSAVLKDVNETAGNPYEVSLSFQASGIAEHNLSVDGTSYGTVFDSGAAVGSPVFIDYNDDMSLETLRLTYHVDEGIRENGLDLFGEDTTELHGIRRLNVFWFDESINMLLPVETFHDEENGLVYADMDKDGVFCLMDMEKWIYGLAGESGISGTESAVYAVENEEIYPESVSGVMDEAAEPVFSEEELMERIGALYSAMENNADAPAAFSAGSRRKAIKKSTPVDFVVVLKTEAEQRHRKGIQGAEYRKVYALAAYNTLVHNDGFSNMRICILEEHADGTYSVAGKNRAYWNENTGYDRNTVWSYVSRPVRRSALEFVLSSEMGFREDSVKFVTYIPLGETDMDMEELDRYVNEMAQRGICYLEVHDSTEPYGEDTDEIQCSIRRTGGDMFFTEDSMWGENAAALYYNRIKNPFRPAEKPQTVFQGITATGYRTITLEQPLDSASRHDSDGDGLTDWEEVNTELLIWNRDGSITLPTLLYCVENYSEDSYVIAGLERFKKDVTQHGVPSNIYEDYIRHVMRNTNILPIHSHPRRVDTDGDGILDNLDRYNSETMDVRYRNVSPLRVNTIETLYPELKKSGQNPSNNEQNAVYFNIDGNDIELVARILFYDDYAQKFIENGVELNKTYEDVILEGLKLWSGKFTGAYSKGENVHYDFIEGLKINVAFTAEVYHEEDLFSDNRYVHIYVENDEYTGGKWYDSCYGIPHTDTQGWSPEKIGTGILWDCGQITMYRGYADHPKYDESGYQHTIAHEFGHVLGLDDAYPGANGGIKLEKNEEVPIEVYYDGILMCNNGFSYANDIEMILQAFLERKYQSYFEYKKNEKSKVIRLKQTFEGDSQ